MLGNTTGVQLNEVNRVYLANSLVLEECFRRVEFYDVHQFDFSDPAKLAKEINGVVDWTTKGLIPELLTPGSLAGAMLVLINALYFKGSWKYPFDKSQTSSQDFFCNPEVPCGKVDMMAEYQNVNYDDNSDLGAQVIELPYISSSMSMLIFLPWKNKTVDEVVDRLSMPTIAAALQKFGNRAVVLKFPKFKLEQTLEDELQKALGELGIRDLFSGNVDLSAFTKLAQLNAANIVHKAVIDVNEEGTEAAAASAVVFPFSLPPVISINRPFVFMIVDKNIGLIFFSGIYRTPPPL